MFAIDAIQHTKPTEPAFFKLIRLVCAVFFVTILLYYAVLQSEAFISGINKPNIILSQLRTKVYFPGFTICPHNPNTTQYLDDPESGANIYLGKRSPQGVTTPTPTPTAPAFYSYNVTCEFHNNMYGPGMLTEALDFTTTESLACNNFLQKRLGCYQFRPTREYFNEYDNRDPSFVYENYTLFRIQNTITPYFALFLDQYDEDYKFFSRLHPDQPKSKQQKAILYNWHSIDTNKTTFFEYIITILQTYSTSYFGQLGVQPEINSLKFDVEKNFLPGFRNDEIIFIVKPKPPYHIHYETQSYQNHPVNMISKLGGFYGAIAGIFFLLFGNPRLAPWGIVQRYCLRCWPFRRSFKRHLAARYISSAGIPFGEYVEERPEGSSIERRLQILETLLKEYYIDTYYLDILRKTKIRYQLEKEKYDLLESSEEETLIVNDKEVLSEISIEK